MMKIILIIFLFINPVNDLNRIAEINSLKKEAKEAYTSGDYEQAVLKYEKLVNEYGLGDENILLNLANSYYKKENSEKALELYASLQESSNTDISSAAYNQTGLMAHQQKKNEEAINYFKEALKANPSNDAARFNYVKLKKELEEEQKKKDQENKENKENKDEKNKDKKEQEKKEDGDKKDGEEGEEEKKDKGKQGEEEKEEEQKKEGEKEEGEEQEPPQQSTADKLQEMNMSEEKAQMILEAMKNNEIQYIQQNQKKPQSNVDDGKPDW